MKSARILAQVESIRTMAARASGVTLAQISAELCVGYDAVKKRMSEASGLHKVTLANTLARGRPEARWFATAELAQAYLDSKGASNCLIPSEQLEKLPAGGEFRMAQPRTPAFKFEAPGTTRASQDTGRPGAFDFRNCPSRRGNKLVYPDGRVEHIA